MKTKKLLIILIFTISLMLLLTTKSKASLYLNNLDFDAQINSDGTMDVTETWNIDISNTNTLYKTFKRDKTKYSAITNVVVTEVGKNEFAKSDKWAYHLPKNYYYGGLNDDNQYEICWGVGLDNSSDTRTYKISYTVTDAIAKYNDIAELYWQFIGSDFEVSAKNITGTIKLPQKADSKQDIKVWGHVDTLNGEIYATSEDTVEFTLNNFRSGRYVEIRVAFPTKLVASSGRTYNKEKLSSIIAEETKWANRANEIRKRQQLTEKLIKIGAIVVEAGISILLIFKAKKYVKVLQTTKKLEPIEQLEYFREIPEKNRTPADAIFVYNKGTTNSSYFGRIFSSTLLNLALKGYLKIETELNEKGKEQVYISILKELQELTHEERTIAAFVKVAIGNKERITIKELQKYITNHSTTITRLIEQTDKTIKSKNIDNGNYDEVTAKQKNSYVGNLVGYIILAFVCVMGLAISQGALLLVILFVVDAILVGIINKKLTNLTQQGVDEREKWKGLKKYMEDFSLLNEKEVPALVVWEEFLVYATVFGIADKVIKQLKLVYPEIENMDSINNTSYIYLMSHTNFNSSFNSAINSSISSAMSSGSGGGGGFSGGGGGGRRPEVAGGGR